MINSHILITVAVIALVTALLRFFPFIIFSDSRKTPRFIEKLSKILPFAIMGMLVVYCFKEISFTSISEFLPMLIAGGVVSVLHIWKRNTLLSVICGTVCHMVLVQLVF